jgi:predicted MPP superfamily phosphohydrolase
MRTIHSHPCSFGILLHSLHRQGRVQLEHREVHLHDLPESLAGTKIVQLSDFHSRQGGLNQAEHRTFERVIQLVSEAEPDLIVLTGDFIDYDADSIGYLVPYIARLQALSKHGVLAVLGNHDYINNRWQTVVRALNNIPNVTVLDHGVANLGEGLDIVGYGDLWNSQFRPQNVHRHTVIGTSNAGTRPSSTARQQQLEDHCDDRGVTRLVLAHNPDTATPLNQQGCRADLILSGHTHGGMVRIPWLHKPGRAFSLMSAIKHIHDEILPATCRWLLPVWKLPGVRCVNNWKWAHGLHVVERDRAVAKWSHNNKLYINRGVGDLNRRLFCRPEVTLLTLQRNGSSRIRTTPTSKSDFPLNSGQGSEL